VNLFFLIIIILLFLLCITFSVIDLFLFYLFFESSLIPTLFLIVGWGYQPERLQAGIYLLFYTLLASLPLLLGIFYIFRGKNTLNILLLIEENYKGYYYYLYMRMILAFFVKIPIFIVHL
jgi:NADH-ubiquinone oxidoreductase chain 4